MAEILIVDDEPMMRQVISSLLKAQGHTVTECDNGDDAIAQVKSGQPFNLMVSDIRMNPTSGMDVLDAVREIDPELPVVLVSAYASDEVRKDAAARGARRLLGKPFNMSEFLDTVNSEMRNGSA